MPRNHGLPYMGSKNRLAERIVSLLPRRTHLIDLFCGGCAVSHAALLRGGFSHIHINDLDWRAPTLFTDALCGRYADERRWISREDFFRLREADPYVAICWSFGNNQRTYLYSREIEPLKRAMHYAVCYADSAPAADLGIDLSPAVRLPTEEERMACVRKMLKERAASHGEASGGYFPSKLRGRQKSGKDGRKSRSSTSIVGKGLRKSASRAQSCGRLKASAPRASAHSLQPICWGAKTRWKAGEACAA